MKIVDMHAHILPGIDDGSKSIKMSMKMLDSMKDMGISIVCATSHFYREQNDIRTFLKRRNDAYKKLVEVRGNTTLPIILPASETAYFRNMALEKDLKELCIYNTNTLMLEMPFMEWNNAIVEEVESIVLDKDIRVVLVHPERFCFSSENKKYLKRLVELDIPLQVNAGSLIDRSTRKLALELLELTSHPLLGSDSHNITTRVPNLDLGREIVEKKLGPDFLRKIEKNCYRYMYDANYKL